jgi:hypothetical protein
VAKVGTSKAGGTISQQAAVHPWLAADAHGNKQTNKQTKNKQKNKQTKTNKQTKNKQTKRKRYSSFYNRAGETFLRALAHIVCEFRKIVWLALENFESSLP